MRTRAFVHKSAVITGFNSESRHWKLKKWKNPDLQKKFVLEDKVIVFPE